MARSNILNVAKIALKATVFRPGAVRTVLWGPCRGLRYRIFPQYGHSYLFGGWERKAVRLMVKHVTLNSVAYDLGANYGMHTLLLARLVGPMGLVYAFEPEPEIFSALNDQLALNHFDMVHTFQRAVAAEVGSAFFDRAHHRGAGHLVSETDGRVATSFQVQTTTLDKFVFQEGHAPPSFVKIDIEGAESAALRGSLGVIAQYRPIFLIELHNPREDRSVGAILKSFGYVAVQVETGRLVRDMEKGWPDSDGIWGTVLAHPQ